MTEGKLTGCVVWFNLDKGYGFLKIDGKVDASENLFVHASELAKSGVTHIERDMTPGRRVSFDSVPTPKDASKNHAVNIAVL